MWVYIWVVGKIGVPQQFLHYPQVCPAVQHVSGESVAYHVRVNLTGDACQFAHCLQLAFHTAGAEALPVFIEKNRRTAFPVLNLGAPGIKIGGKGN